VPTTLVGLTCSRSAIAFGLAWGFLSCSEISVVVALLGVRLLPAGAGGRLETT